MNQLEAKVHLIKLGVPIILIMTVSITIFDCNITLNTIFACRNIRCRDILLVCFSICAKFESKKREKNFNFAKYPISEHCYW